MPFNASSRVGEIRPSQLLREFGVGALIDLPNISAIVLGLEEWEQYYQQPQEISEERLRAAVQQWLGKQVSRLRTPPMPTDSDGGFGAGAANPAGAPVAAFPRWMVCPFCHLLAPVESGLFQLRANAYHPEQTSYVHVNCTKPKSPPQVLPARFLAVCERGHLDDFPWLYYVHHGAPACESPRLTMRDSGFSSDVADVRVRCESCGSPWRTMAGAFGAQAKQSLPQCRGRRPHLRDFADDDCAEQVSTLLLGASNTWFPVLLSALTVPKEADPLSALLDLYWTTLAQATNEQNVELMRSLGLLPLLSRFSASEIWEATERRKAGSEAAEESVTDLRAPEWRAFTGGADVLGHPHFRIRSVEAPPDFDRLFEQVVLVERLREVNALVGFTRLSSLGDVTETGDASAAINRWKVELSRKPPTWAPAFEVHGEGIFLRFCEEAIADWLNRPTLQAREAEFRRAHAAWCERRYLTPPGNHYPGLRYVLLHSFAHALMRQLSLEAGYSMASLSERIYARAPEADGGPMAGLLIYTSAPDSEGTLGGLVHLGRPDRLAGHIQGALESIRWCASDPLCSSHAPRHDADELHGAACHACLFAPETSCERGNRYLDRSLVLPTMDYADMAFFAEAGGRGRTVWR